MEDSIKEISTESYGARLMNSIKGVLTGLMLFCASFVILWWNEGNIVDEKAALKQMAKQHVSIKAQQPQDKNNNKLIYTTAQLKSSERLGDSHYLKPGPWLKLESSVEMYQWIEETETKTENKTGGSKTTETTYRYKLDWAEGRKNSSNFKKASGHENPPLSIAASKHRVAGVQFGAFDGSEVLERLSPNTKLNLKTEMLLKPESLKIIDQKIYIPASSASTSPKHQGPQIGDIRISYQVLNSADYSVMATQVQSSPKTKHSFQDFQADNGKSKFLIEKGIVTPKAMLKSAEDSAKTLTMILRIAGFLAMAFGIGMILNPFATLLDVLPILGTLGKGAIAIFSIVVAGILSTVTIIIAMIAHNPILLGGTIILITGGIGFYLKQKSDKSKVNQQFSNPTHTSAQAHHAGKEPDASRKEAA